MPRTCTVCSHASRKAIDKALLDGEPVRALASRYVPLKSSSIQRHKDEHLPAKMAKAKAANEVSQADDLLAHVRALEGKALSLLKQAEGEGDFRTALAGVREARACVELLAKLRGELDTRPQINLTLSGEWLQVRAVIIGALSDYPDARQNVARALMELES